MSDDMKSGGLPSYQDAVEEKGSDYVPPSLLSIGGQTIYIQGSGDLPTAAAYQLNRGIASLSHATSDVTFARMTQTRGGAKEKTGSSTCSTSRHIYNIKYIHRAPGGLEGVPSDSPHYYVEAVSSRMTLGSLGMKKSSLRKQWKVIPLDLSGKNSSYRLPQFVKNAEAVFTLSVKDEQCTWADAQGSTVAEEIIPDTEQSEPKLQVTTALPRDLFDMLVALWCCHVWQQSADGQPRVQSRLESMRHKLNLSKEMPSRGNQFMRF